jgi:hypothetical protein
VLLNLSHQLQVFFELVWLPLGRGPTGDWSRQGQW